MGKWTMKVDGHLYPMDVGPVSFIWTADRDLDNRPTLILLWERGTQMRNFSHMTIVTLRNRWPFVRRFSGFVDTDS